MYMYMQCVHAFTLTVTYYIVYCSYVCCFLQLKEKSSRIEELNGEVLSVQGQLENVASTLNVNKVDVYL